MGPKDIKSCDCDDDNEKLLFFLFHVPCFFFRTRVFYYALLSLLSISLLPKEETYVLVQNEKYEQERGEIRKPFLDHNASSLKGMSNMRLKNKLGHATSLLPKFVRNTGKKRKFNCQFCLAMLWRTVVVVPITVLVWSRRGGRGTGVERRGGSE